MIKFSRVTVIEVLPHHCWHEEAGNIKCCYCGLLDTFLPSEAAGGHGRYAIKNSIRIYEKTLCSARMTEEQKKQQLFEDCLVQSINPQLITNPFISYTQPYQQFIYSSPQVTTTEGLLTYVPYLTGQVESTFTGNTESLVQYFYTSGLGNSMSGGTASSNLAYNPIYNLEANVIDNK